MMSPMSPLFRPIQDHLKHLQVPRSNITYKNMLGEGAFGEVRGVVDRFRWLVYTLHNTYTFVHAYIHTYMYLHTVWRDYFFV